MTRRKSSERPSIWAEGRQHPPFEVRAFARATIAFTREGLCGLLERCAASARSGGAAVSEGAWRIPAHRLGRTGRYLPSHRSVGAAILSFAGLLGETAARVKGEEEAPSSIFRASRPPAAEPAPVPPMPRPRRLQAAEPAARTADAPDPAPRKADDPDLAAIRALLTEPPAPAPAPSPAPRPRRASGEPEAAPQPAAPPPAAPPAEPWRRTLLRDAAATALGFGLLVVSVPYGALRATIAHLNGEDLRKLA